MSEKITSPLEKITVTIFCAVCRKGHQIKYFQKDYINWKHNNTFIQQAFPYLTADERELLLTQTCGPCFDEIFSDTDEEKDKDDLDSTFKEEKGTSLA